MATTRPSSRRSFSDEDCAAVRLRSGRTLENFLSLLQCGLVDAPPNQSPGAISPLPSLYAKMQGNHVIILECFIWRGVSKVVVPLVEHHGPNGGTHTIKKRDVETCNASELKNVGFHLHFLGTVQKKPLCLDHSSMLWVLDAIVAYNLPVQQRYVWELRLTR